MGAGPALLLSFKSPQYAAPRSAKRTRLPAAGQWPVMRDGLADGGTRHGNRRVTALTGRNGVIWLQACLENCARFVEWPRYPAPDRANCGYP